MLPEYGAHAFLTLLFLLTGNWTALLFNAPLLGWNINKYVPLVFPPDVHDATRRC